MNLVARKYTQFIAVNLPLVLNNRGFVFYNHNFTFTFAGTNFGSGFARC